MSQTLHQNIRLGVLILAILAGLIMQKHAHPGQHADCNQCIEAAHV